MAAFGSVQFVISGTSLLTAWQQNINETVNLTNPVGEILIVNVTNTPTALVIPAGSTYVFIQPPAANTVNLELGGTGVALGAMLPIHPSNPSCFAIPSTAPVILIACASGTVAGVAVGFY